MKKSLLLATSLVAVTLIFSSCSTLSGINKEKTEDGFIKSHDLVYDTIRYDHPSLVPAFDVGKFNIYGNKQFENIQAYIFNDTFYLEADYGNKSRDSLNIDTIMFFTTRNKIQFKNADPNLPNTYHSFRDIDGLTYENLKVSLTPEDMNLLGRFLIADDVYIAFAGERGRTDIFKLSNKLKKSILAVINKWNKLNNQPVIEPPKPEPKPEPAKETTEEAETTETAEDGAESEEGVTEVAENTATEGEAAAGAVEEKKE